MLRLIAFAFAFFIFATPGQAQTYTLRSAIGTNLAGIAYWSPQLPFVDVMKSSSPWISGDSSKWDNQQPLDLDANGWVRSLAPGQIARTLMMRDIGNHYPAGRYIVRYKGQGTLKFSFAARVVSQKPGEMLVEVTPSSEGGIYLAIEATNPFDYLREIEITIPGGICEGDPFTHVPSARQCSNRRYLSFSDHGKTILFYPVFLSRLRAYSVLRFMDWMQTNNSPVTKWSQQALTTQRTWAGTSGVPIEVMIELANRLGAHPWFTLPHQSDDAYAQNFAQVVKAKLNPTLRVYVEYSNEVWNAQFAQQAYAAKQAAIQSPVIDNMQYHAMRSRALGRIFKDMLGPTRVVAVLGAQAANPWTASRGLDYLKSRFGAATEIDAVAIAPYFDITPDPNEANKFTAMTRDALFAHVRSSVLPVTEDRMRKYRKLTNDYGMQLISYEGGQHLVGIRGAENNNELTALFIGFNRDARIKQLYLDYLAAWKQAGGQLFVHFADIGQYSKWGAWGALEYIDQLRNPAPKFDAIQSFIEHNPVWWAQ